MQATTIPLAGVLLAQDLLGDLAHARLGQRVNEDNARPGTPYFGVTPLAANS
jgi:hypothetical protein